MIKHSKIQSIDAPIKEKTNSKKVKKIKKIPIDISLLGVQIPALTNEIFSQDNFGISTITAQCQPSTEQRINVSLLKQNMIASGILVIQEGEKEFKNQITISISFPYKSKVRKMSIKIFEAGTIHVCGLPNLKIMETALQIVGKLALKFTDKHLEFQKSDIVPCMIVGVIDFSPTNTTMNLRSLSKLLMTKYDVYVNYEPSVYCGLNCKYKCNDGSTVTILIFSSGKMLPSAKSADNLIEAIEFIKGVMKEFDPDAKGISVSRKNVINSIF